MGDREARSTLEALQHELRALTAQWALGETPGFGEARRALERELAPLESRARELAAKVDTSEAGLIAAQKHVVALEDALRRHEQGALSWLLGAVVAFFVLLAAPFSWWLQREWITALCGLWSGWLVAGRAIGRWASADSLTTLVAQTAPRAAESTLTVLMLALSPAVGLLHASAERFAGVSALLRFSVAPVFVVLEGLAARRGRQSVLLASATGAVIVFSLFVGFSSRNGHMPWTGVADQWAAFLNGVTLPMLLVGLWFTASARVVAAWRVLSVALLVATACANVWLTNTFTQVPSFRFVSIAGLAMQLSVGAGFFSMVSPPGRARRVLLALSGVLGGWTAIVFGVLFATRLID